MTLSFSSFVRLGVCGYYTRSLECGNQAGKCCFVRPTDEFTVTATKCNIDSAYLMSSTDSVTDMSVTFINQVSVVKVTFCAKVILAWNNGERVEEVATLIFKMEGEATETGTETLETDTPETALHVTPQEDEIVMTTSVIRPKPQIDLSVQNTSPLYFGQGILIEATSPKEYQFQFVTAQTQGTSDTHLMILTLSMVDPVLRG